MVVNRQRRVPIKDEDLHAFAVTLARSLRLSADSFVVALVSDRRIAALNRRYRGRPGPTDVLSFPTQRRFTPSGFLGDVVISAETARRNARRYRHSPAEEMKLLILHGVLHLLGYDHGTDQGQMHRCEHALRRRLGLE